MRDIAEIALEADGSIKYLWDTGFGWSGVSTAVAAGTLDATANLGAAQFGTDNSRLGAAPSGADVHASREGSGSQLDIFVNGTAGLAKAFTTNGTSWSALTQLP